MVTKSWLRRSTMGLGLGLVLVGAMLSGCGGAGDNRQSQGVTLTVSAAISLSDAFNEAGQKFTAQNPKVQVRFNYGASGTLQQQIEQGSPVDVFVSAGEKQIQALDSKGLMLEDTVRPLLQNTLVLVVPANRPDSLTSFAQLTDTKVQKIAIGNPKTVPAGQYAKEVLESLKLYTPVQRKLVLAEDVRAALTLVATGNADAGLVYRTDALSNAGVKVVAEAPAGSSAPVIYPIGVVRTSTHQEAARQWEDFLLSPDGKGILAKYGFTPAK